MSTNSAAFTSTSPYVTAQLAVRLGASLSAGDTLLLEGDIGAGKSHFARALIQSRLAEPEDVPSPTFTLVQVYDLPECELWHADLYRLNDPDQVVELGLLDAFETAICIIEWPDRLDDLAPADALTIRLDDPDQSDMRNITFEWQNPAWTKRVTEALP
ncbi:tRNA (adenosine(37)-N6)-threonylcarbamoyltransferase complex ATPase subunit type 1 TsaE [Marivita sp. XM-24bin2]|jgi:tRNA threonylcarbamoyladenosine biosynthesis protein TsaE|uniref:tRNA (adenosine(37)-N6)-threonylcarbamoyltransferase complex ATPase subunit type 1 TsaE n=1 Tax=unclassified Marivita TaxID=2632480 RepID=UPI000D796A59|nr:tRNA (adenosine(37)-N6)-threonylcarbamoyltransferase complex ATPase subunit type 1 TsaE [Marivita sp. XM-24bin2]MCR9110163.1 tRNA (adenosine(37)-N6)-threonylcarbamoyltransferase complex ATPase subunit type 1 TsaE [Paracoccaceae bacterium]PWL34325.1 MAG: tRNA (adenosine(37)-N6)-threonylcarbamoyltransferase complex ATPase subunit type 1 TsaE [Marivita sp. XM-24bin2]